MKKYIKIVCLHQELGHYIQCYGTLTQNCVHCLQCKSLRNLQLQNMNVV